MFFDDNLLLRYCMDFESEIVLVIIFLAYVTSGQSAAVQKLKREVIITFPKDIFAIFCYSKHKSHVTLIV